ncbi:MAG: hypothetical protein ACK5MR_05100 [Cumulibacter sp.]
MDVQILSRAGDTNNIQFQDNISIISNKAFDETFAKRFYTFEDLPASDEAITVPVYLDISVTEVINNDTTLKQSTIILERILTESGIGDSNFRSISFLRKEYSDIALLEETTHIDVSFLSTDSGVVEKEPYLVALGGIEIGDITGSNIQKSVEFEYFDGEDQDQDSGATYTVKPASMDCDDDGVCRLVNIQLGTNSAC